MLTGFKDPAQPFGFNSVFSLKLFSLAINNTFYENTLYKRTFNMDIC